VEKLKLENPDVIRNCSATLGLSLGEYTALVFAGAMHWEDALRLIKVRAEAMGQAVQGIFVFPMWVAHSHLQAKPPAWVLFSAWRTLKWPTL
jgi:malonyl CoA-acyl carrier protein transacylase